MPVSGLLADLRDRMTRARESDLWFHFTRSPVTVVAAAVTLLFLTVAAAAPLLAPQNPFDAAALNIGDSRLPPAWIAGGQARYPLGTESQGRDVLSTIIYGSRISLGVSFAATLFAMLLGVSPVHSSICTT